MLLEVLNFRHETIFEGFCMQNFKEHLLFCKKNQFKKLKNIQVFTLEKPVPVKTLKSIRRVRLNNRKVLRVSRSKYFERIFHSINYKNITIDHNLFFEQYIQALGSLSLPRACGLIA